MVQEALRYAAAQAAGLPGIASALEKDSFLAPLLAGDGAPFLSVRMQVCELTTMYCAVPCPYSLPSTTITKLASIQQLLQAADFVKASIRVGAMLRALSSASIPKPPVCRE